MSEKLQYCRICGDQHPADKLSNRGICGRCGAYLFTSAMKQLQMKDGPIYKKWRNHYIAAMDGVLAKLRKEQ